MTELQHRPTCPGPQIRTGIGKLGDPFTGCTACGVIHFDNTQRLTTEATPDVRGPLPATLRPLSRYRCREHPAQPVTWKGTGCRSCVPTHGLNRAERRRLLREAYAADRQPTDDSWESNE